MLKRKKDLNKDLRVMDMMPILIEINKIALSYSDDKRLIAFGGITSYPYRKGAGILCKQELLSKVSRKC